MQHSLSRLLRRSSNSVFSQEIYASIVIIYVFSIRGHYVSYVAASFCCAYLRLYWVLASSTK